MLQVKVFGRWHPIPRQQVAFGDKGLSYRFSGNNIAAKSWTPLLTSIRNLINQITGVDFNFVLINRFLNEKFGIDKILMLSFKVPKWF